MAILFNPVLRQERMSCNNLYIKDIPFTAAANEELQNICEELTSWKEKVDELCFDALDNLSQEDPLGDSLFEHLNAHKHVDEEAVKRIEGVKNSSINGVNYIALACYRDVQNHSELEGCLVLKYNPTDKDSDNDVVGQDDGALSSKTMYISHLVTHFKNSSYDLNIQKEALKGVGTELINRAKELCLELDLSSIKLQSLSNSVAFYKSCGFERSSSEAEDFGRPRRMEISRVEIEKSLQGRVSALNEKVA